MAEVFHCNKALPSYRKSFTFLSHDTINSVVKCRLCLSVDWKKKAWKKKKSWTILEWHEGSAWIVDHSSWLRCLMGLRTAVNHRELEECFALPAVSHSSSSSSRLSLTPTSCSQTYCKSDNTFSPTVWRNRKKTKQKKTGGINSKHRPI